MADDRRGRDKKAHDTDRRQRQRELEEALDRMDEPEPPLDVDELLPVDQSLTTVSFPATGTEVIKEAGETAVESTTASYRLKELIPETDSVSFSSELEILQRVQRPTVAETMARITEAAVELPHTTLEGSQRRTYKKTLDELRSLVPDDEDEGVTVVGNWIIEQIETKEKLPASRAVRRRARKFCNANGYPIGNDSWLGV